MYQNNKIHTCRYSLTMAKVIFSFVTFYEYCLNDLVFEVYM